MKIEVRTSNVFIIRENNPNSYLSFDELYELTGSKKLLEIVRKRNSKDLTLTRTPSGKFLIMDDVFYVGEVYKYYCEIDRYICISYDTASNTAILRRITHRRKLITMDNTIGWTIYK